jgi:hypothetical protein
MVKYENYFKAPTLCSCFIFYHFLSFENKIYCSSLILSGLKDEHPSLWTKKVCNIVFQVSEHSRTLDPEDVRLSAGRLLHGPQQHSHRPHPPHPQRHDQGLSYIYTGDVLSSKRRRRRQLLLLSGFLVCCKFNRKMSNYT